MAKSKARGDVFLRHLVKMLQTPEDRRVVGDALKFALAMHNVERLDGGFSVYSAFMAIFTEANATYRYLLRQRGIEVEG